MTKADLVLLKNASAKMDLQDLVDISTIEIETSAGKQERITQYLDAIKNPYHFRVGNTVVHVQFADTATTVQDSVTNVFLRR